MTDIIWGTATKILDNSSFELNVTHRKDENKNNYSDNEIIVFTEIDIVSIPSDPNMRTVQQIENALKDKFIKCEIMSRSENSDLVCKVFHSGAGGY
tara:strand:- start:2860 stop:3147 length:288 start_codon:yes stop_codon:yes gene_type:complete